MNVRTRPTLTGMLAIAAAGIFAAGTVGGWANKLYGTEDAGPAQTPASYVDVSDVNDPATDVLVAHREP